MKKLIRDIHRVSLLVGLMFTLVSCNSEITADLLGVSNLIKLEPKFSIVAKRSSATLDVSSDYLDVGDTVDIVIYDEDGERVTDGERISYKLNSGSGNVHEASNARGVFVAESRGYGSVLIEFDGGEKVITFLINPVPNPTSLTLGATPDSLTQTPSVSWSNFKGQSVEVAIYREDNDALIENWQTITNGSSITSSNLINFNEYYFMVRGVEVSSDKTTPEKLGPWTVNKLPEITSYTRVELSNIFDIEYARSKYYVIENVSGGLGVNRDIYTSSSLSSAFSAEVNLTYPQSLASHLGEIYVLGEQYAWRGDGSTVSFTEGGYQTYSPTVSDGYLFTGGSTGSNLGNRYYAIDIATFTLANDVRDFESGNGRGESTIVFNSKVLYSGETESNASNPLHIHEGDSSDPTTVSSLTIEPSGLAAPDANSHRTQMVEVDEQAVVAILRNSSNYSFTLDGTIWNPETLPGGTESIKYALADSEGVFILSEPFLGGGYKLWRFYPGSVNDPSVVHTFNSSAVLSKIKLLPGNKIAGIGNNGTGSGYIEIIDYLYGKPEGL